MDELSLPTPKRKPGRELLVLGFIVAVLGLLIGLYLLTLGRSPLAGPNTHDFGFVMISNGSASVEHTFTLTNRTSRTLELGRPRPSCGCTVSGLSTNTVEPGEQVSVTAKLTLSQAGRRSSDIAIPIEGRGVRMLSITGIGRPVNEIHARRERIILAPGSETTVGFSVDAWTDVWHDVREVPKPKIDVPDGVSARFERWVLRAIPEHDRPARWEGQVVLALEGDALPEDAMFVVTLREGQELRMPILPADTRE
jgi:hypothetical protein